jgi:hypothetical protein
MRSSPTREHLFHTVPPRVEVFKENDAVVALMTGRPFAAEGADLESALAELMFTLREYAEDWENRLQNAPNHAAAWALVQLVKLSTDEQLLEWFDRGGE